MDKNLNPDAEAKRIDEQAKAEKIQAVNETIQSANSSMPVNPTMPDVSGFNQLADNVDAQAESFNLDGIDFSELDNTDFNPDDFIPAVSDDGTDGAEMPSSETDAYMANIERDFLVEFQGKTNDEQISELNDNMKAYADMINDMPAGEALPDEKARLSKMVDASNLPQVYKKQYDKYLNNIGSSAKTGKKPVLPKTSKERAAAAAVRKPLPHKPSAAAAATAVPATARGQEQPAQTRLPHEPQRDGTDTNASNESNATTNNDDDSPVINQNQQANNPDSPSTPSADETPMQVPDGNDSDDNADMPTDDSEQAGTPSDSEKPADYDDGMDDDGDLDTPSTDEFMDEPEPDENGWTEDRNGQKHIDTGFADAKPDAHAAINNAAAKASDGVNNGLSNVANAINGRMQKNGNGNLFGPGKSSIGKLGSNVGNWAWKHGGSNAAAKALGGANRMAQNAIRSAQQLANRIVNLAKSIASVVTSPVTWIITVIVVISMIIATCLYTYGNGGILCPSKDGSGGGNEAIASWAEKIAADDSHGYSQPNRQGNPDYDCSSLVYFAVTKGAGIQLSINYPFATGSNIDQAGGEGGVLQAAGFQKISWDGHDTSVLKRGDIVWSDHHTEIYSGDGKFTGARHDENGGITGPQAGDQKGDEIATSNGIPSGMSYVLRAPGKSTSDTGTSSGAAGDFSGENAKQIFEYLTKEMGFSGAGAAGALAVAMRESGFDPKAKNPGGGVAGIFQWSGYSPGPNGNRIIAEGSIKAGDDSTLTMENELKLVGFELNGAYHKAKTTVGNASDPTQAAKDWSVLFEGVPLSDGQSKVSQIEQWAKQACDQFNCESIEAQPDKLAEGGDGTDSSNPSTTKNADSSVQCMMSKNNTGANTDFKVGKGDYSWLCDTPVKICKSGDYGPIAAPYRYQCVWYAWTRLYMLHGNKDWSYTGNGGQIGQNATAHGWTNPDKPAVGDGLSYYGLLGSSGSPIGHVMVIEKVEDDPSGWKITVSEGNSNCASSGCWEGYNGGRTMTKAQIEAAGGRQGSNYWFFHNPAWDSESSNSSK